MKKLLVWLCCVVMLLSVTACGGEEKTEVDAPATSTTDTDSAEGTVPSGESTTTPTATGDKTSGTKKPTGTTTQGNNEVDWNNVFGNDTTQNPTGSTSGTKKPTSTKSSTTTKPTSTEKPTTTTTLKPTTIDQVSLPAAGTDLDPGKPGRIKLDKIALKAGVVTFTIRNCTDTMKQKWITQETDYITYACYDKNGKKLTSKDEVFGYLYIGCLEVGEEVTLKVTLPKGTTRVEITGSKIHYWTPWTK